MPTPVLLPPSYQQYYGYRSAKTGGKEVSGACPGHEETQNENGFLLSFEAPRKWETKIRQVDYLDKQL